MISEADLFCGTCERSVRREVTVRGAAAADLDPEKWQSLRCPDCDRTLKTVFVARAELQ